MSFKSQGEEYYQEHYAGRGIAPKHVVALKEVLAKAFRKGEKPSVAARGFIKEKGIALKDADEPKTAAKSEPAKTKTPVIGRPTMEVAKMDRKSLKAVVAELQAGGVDIKVSKEDDDDTLKKKVNDALVQLPSPEMIEKLESLDPKKLHSAIGQDCIGLFVDLRSVACTSCVDSAACVKKYLENLKGDFSMFKDAVVAIRTEEVAEEVGDEEAEAMKTKSSTKAEAKAAKKAKDHKPKKMVKAEYDPARRIFVMGIENPNEKKDEAYQMIQEVLDEVPDNLKDLRAIVDRHYDFDNDADFVEDFVDGLREAGVFKFEEDLSPKQRAKLEKAGIL